MQEYVLIKMLRYAATKCPEDDFERICQKFKINGDDVTTIMSQEGKSFRDRLFKLFTIWRERQPVAPDVVQQKFIHAIDLVDLPRLVSQLRAITTYTKATRL
uniref:LRRD1 death domain-containing protein n=1 Tax=Ciona intestinalis TaxID=7719 RepID=H2XT46_CIOIN